MIITMEAMRKMKGNAIVRSIGHFDIEIEMVVPGGFPGSRLATSC